MPLFMDRHDVRDATAEAVAAAHQQDIKLQADHGCKTLTYWFDEQRGTAFCLIEAPSESAVHALHRQAHGLIPNMVIEVQAAAVANFLGRITDQARAAASPIREPGFRALMFTDMAGSTEITNALGDVRAREIVAKHHEIVRAALLAHQGREIDRAGDGFLASFPSVSRAVACAVDIQRAMARYNAGRDLPRPIQLRIGLGAGEPLMDGPALFGSTVNLTFRICSAAAPGQILAARVVRELARGRSFRFKRQGEVALKGFPEPVELHEVDWAE